MFMGNQYPVDLPERQVDNLFAEVGPQSISRRVSPVSTSTEARRTAVVRVGRTTYFAGAAHFGYTGGSSAA
jgi:hypothetical protein